MKSMMPPASPSQRRLRAGKSCPVLLPKRYKEPAKGSDRDRTEAGWLSRRVEAWCIEHGELQRKVPHLDAALQVALRARAPHNGALSDVGALENYQQQLELDRRHGHCPAIAAGRCNTATARPVLQEGRRSATEFDLLCALIA